MFPPFACCSRADSSDSFRRHHQERKLRMLTFWREGLERQLAALDATISTLRRQMETPGDA
jgi:hypothetical protein